MVVTTRTERPIPAAGGASAVPRSAAPTATSGALFSSAVGSRSSATAATLYSAWIVSPGFISANRVTCSPTSYSPTLPCGPLSVMRRFSASTASTENATWMAAASPRATGPSCPVMPSPGAPLEDAVSAVDALSLGALEQDANVTLRIATNNTRYMDFMTGSFLSGELVVKWHRLSTVLWLLESPPIDCRWAA